MGGCVQSKAVVEKPSGQENKNDCSIRIVRSTRSNTNNTKGAFVKVNNPNTNKVKPKIMSPTKTVKTTASSFNKKKPSPLFTPKSDKVKHIELVPTSSGNTVKEHHCTDDVSEISNSTKTVKSTAFSLNTRYIKDNHSSLRSNKAKYIKVVTPTSDNKITAEKEYRDDMSEISEFSFSSTTAAERYRRDLEDAIKKDRVNSVRCMLLDHGSDIVRATDKYGWTSLHNAIKVKASQHIVHMLVDCGGKDVVNARDGFGSTAFYIACRWGASVEILRLLVEKGGVDVIKPFSNNSRTPLEDGLKYGNVQYLVEAKFIFRKAIREQEWQKVYDMIVDPAEYPPGLEERLPVTKLTVNQRKEPFSFSKTNARDQTFQNLYARYSSTITYLEEALFSGFCDRVLRKKVSKQDAVDLAKMVSIRSICIGKSRETEIIDLSKVPMIDEYRVEVFLASLQCFEEHKFNIVKNYGPNRLQNIDMLLEHISDSSLPLPNTTFYHHCYQKLIIYLRNSIKGLTDISDVLSDFSYKSLQAIFDELYIRKGRNEINMLRDVGSATFFLSSKSLLNQVLDTFNKDFNDNFNISDSFWTGEGGVSKNDISSILREFGRMKPLNPDAPFDERIYPFQIKRHNSHGTEKETDNSLHILHFFIGFPVCSFTTTMTVICAYELVIGVKDDIEEFKLARDNLERERILDQLPALENISNGVETNNNECKDTIEELNAYQSIMKSYGGIDCDLSYSQCDKIYCDEKFPWEEGNKDACPKITCLNSVRITTWTHNPEKNHRCVKLWENSLPQDLTNNRFQVKDCTVFADSYGEGGLFFISLIAKLHEASNTWVEIASRCIGPSEKENWTGSVCLVNERFSYSSCELGTFLPPNSISVALIACGAFSSWKQDLVYAGHKLILSYDNKKDYVESIDKKTGDFSMEASQVEMNQEQDREEEDSGSESEIQSENSFAEEIENSTDRVVIGEGRKRNGVEEVVCNKIHQDEHTHNKIIESYVENAIQVDITCSGRLEIEKGKLMDDLDKNNVDDYDCEELNKKENSGMTEMEEQNNNVAREVKDCGDDKAETAENDRPGMMKEGKKISKGNLKKDEDSVSGNVEKNVDKVVKAQNGKKSSYENNIAFQIKNDNGGKGIFLECDGRVKVEDEVGIIDGIRKEREEGQENGGVIKVTVKGSKEDNNEMIENREEGGIDNCAKFDQNRAETNRKENDVISGKKDEEDSNEDGLANFTDVCIENSKNSKQENQERNISRKKKRKRRKEDE